jgi:hypothetical protein
MPPAATTVVLICAAGALQFHHLTTHLHEIVVVQIHVGTVEVVLLALSLGSVAG